MATSQNGWGLTTSANLNKSPFPGTNIVPVPGTRAGNVSVILHYVGQEFNKRVEPLVNPGCWGYANKKIGSTNVWSNHASATAIDLNAPKHPLGKSGTFTAAQVAQIRAILNYLEGSVRWLEGFDEMHFEIVANEAEVNRIAAKIQGGGVPDVIDWKYLPNGSVFKYSDRADVYWKVPSQEAYEKNIGSGDRIVDIGPDPVPVLNARIAQLEKQLAEKPTTPKEIPVKDIEKIVLK